MNLIAPNSAEKLPHFVFPLAEDAEQRAQIKRNPSNLLKTTKYNFVTFLPATIMLQLAKVVNLFYLVNGIMQCFPAISTNNPMASLVPLAFVILLGVIKEAIVEAKRWQEDRAFNSTKAQQITIKDNQICRSVKRLDEIHVGDILEISDDEQLPADCVLLWAQDPKGKVYIQTAQLDGERALKPKFAPMQIQRSFETLFCAHKTPGWHFEVKTVLPNPNLY
jgi:magnesium-transporting ATPase (P-type)